jgi:ATP-dependent DNA ligase
VKIEVCAGLKMPFYPMRPVRGRALLRPANIRELCEEVAEGVWVMQPKLNGDRVSLACVDGKIHAQNRHGGHYRFKVHNAPDFLKLPNRTCFDGEVFKGNFYPFELLVSNGESFLMAEVHERVRLAKDMVQFLGHPWMFDPPTLAWIMRRKANLPVYEGVVIKRAHSRYLTLGSATQSSAHWMKRLWH